MNKTVAPSYAISVNHAIEPFVELRFPVRGTIAPSDHCYALLASCTKLQPLIREQDDLSILSIPGFGDKQGKILLTEHSCVRMRVPVSKIPLVYGFAGKRLKLGIHEVQLGIPETSALTPASTLQARIVTIKGYVEPISFIAAAERQLENLGIKGKVSVPNDRQGNPRRKTIKIKRFTVVGFTARVSNLSDEDSILLQQVGIGGKRRMGCGYFLPCKGGSHDS